MVGGLSYAALFSYVIYSVRNYRIVNLEFIALLSVQSRQCTIEVRF